MSGGRLARLAVRCTTASSRHAPAVLGAALVLTVLAAGWTAGHLSVNSDTGSLISDHVPWRRAFLAYESEFPQLRDEIQIVIRGATPEAAEEVQSELGRRLSSRPDLYRNVYLPGGGPFFERNGLLYSDTAELEELSRQVARFEPALRALEVDPSLPVLVDLIAADLRGDPPAAGPDPDDEGPSDGDASAPELAGPLLQALALGLRSQLTRQRFQLSWRSVLVEEDPRPDDRLRFIVLNPVLDYTRPLPAAPALDDLRAHIEDITERGPPAIDIRVTGAEAIEHEALESAMASTRVTGLLALALVALVLWLGLRSMSLVAASLLTLIAGLTWTTAFAALAVGELNMISIAFAVIYVGLGIDYAVHFCLGTTEALAETGARDEALALGAGRVGGSLAMSALTTAACFYAFVPTDFSGVSQLGIIGGTGMLISLVATLTVLPALMSVRPLGLRAPRTLPGGEGGAGGANGSALQGRIRRWRGPILAVAAVLVVVAAFTSTRVRFDQDPMNLSDPNSESVRTYRELRNDPNTAPMAISVLAAGPDSARVWSRRLRELGIVSDVRTPLDLVPPNQEARLEIIRGIRLAGPGAPPRGDEAGARVSRRGVGEAIESVEALRETLALEGHRLPAAEAGTTDEMRELLRLWRLWLGLWQPSMQDRLVRELEYGLVGSVPWDVRRLREGHAAERFDLDALPAALRDRWIGREGSWRVQVFPAENLSGSAELARFVDGIRRAAPGATGVPVNNLESSRVAIAAFRRAFALALLSIAVLLYLLYRSPARVALTLTPLLVAAVLTFGFAGAIGLEMNFANLITLPLLLGIGVDNAIHVVHRVRSSGAGTPTIYGTSTAKAVLVATLTTLVTVGSLSLSGHRGLASLGQLLAVGMVALLFTTLVLLPALLTFRTPSADTRRLPHREARFDASPP